MTEKTSAMDDIRESSRSDISANTDMKVFQGYLSNNTNDIFKSLNNNQSPLHKNKKPPSPSSSSSSSPYLSKINEYKDENLPKTNDQPQLFLVRNLPSSSISRHIDILSFGNLNETLGKTNQLSTPPNNPNPNLNASPCPTPNLNNEEDNKSNTSKQSRKSKKSNLSLNDPIIEEPIKAFITTLNDDDEIPNHHIPSKENQNIFWKAHHTTEDDNDNNNEVSNDLPKKEPSKIKSYKNIIDSFTVAKIEKGIALLVSNDDCIFTLPTFILPNGIKIGNTYKFSIDENASLYESETSIKMLQKRLITTSPLSK